MVRRNNCGWPDVLNFNENCSKDEGGGGYCWTRMFAYKACLLQRYLYVQLYIELELTILPCSILRYILATLIVQQWEMNTLLVAVKSFYAM